MVYDSKSTYGLSCGLYGGGIRKFNLGGQLSGYNRKRPSYGSMHGCVVPVVFCSDPKKEYTENDNKLRGIEIPADYRNSPIFGGFAAEAKFNAGESTGLDRINRYLKFVNDKIRPEAFSEADIFAGCSVDLDTIISRGIGECAEGSTVLKTLLDEDLSLKKEGWKFRFVAGRRGIKEKDNHAWISAKRGVDYLLTLDAIGGEMYLHVLNGRLKDKKKAGYTEDEGYLIFRQK